MHKAISAIKAVIKKSIAIFKYPIIQLSQVYFNIVGYKVVCNVCNYKFNKFKSGYWHKNTICPNCSSNVRLRLLMATLIHHPVLNFKNIIDNKKVLHFAPELPLRKIIAKKAGIYHTADFLAEGYSYGIIDFNLDISNMQTVKDNTYDCVIACDVLEHVPNHKAGMQEVNRVLQKSGYCIFTVPQKDNLAITFEDLSLTSKEDRLKNFGQEDHLRIYGNDFSALLSNYGFDVTEIDESYFDKKIKENNVLFPPVLSNNPLATNYRKVFIGIKK